MNPNIGINYFRTKYIQSVFNNSKYSDLTKELKFSDTSGSANSTTKNEETSFIRKHPVCFALQIIGFFAAFFLLVIVIPAYFTNFHPTTNTVLKNNSTAVTTLPIESINITKAINESQPFSFDTCRTYYENGDENSLSSAKSPWLVRIVYTFWTNIYQCTGNIIRDNVILTAAHCLLGDILEIHYGGTPKNNYTDIIRIPGSEMEAIMHEKFEFENFKKIYDIGVIKLKNKIEFSKNAAPICLPFSNADLPNNLAMNIWKTDQTFDMSRSERNIKLINSRKCYKMYRKIGKKKLNFYNNRSSKDEKIIFCGNTNGYIEQGHSGSAVVKRIGRTPIAHGIYSLGGSKNNLLPGVFALTKAHREWIFNNT